MLGAPDIIGAGYEYDFTWSYTLEIGYSIFVQWDDIKQVYNSRVTDEIHGCESPAMLK